MSQNHGVRRLSATITEDGDWWRLAWEIDGVRHERTEATAAGASRFFADWATARALDHGESTIVTITWCPASRVGRAVVATLTMDAHKTETP